MILCLTLDWKCRHLILTAIMRYLNFHLQNPNLEEIAVESSQSSNVHDSQVGFVIFKSYFYGLNMGAKFGVKYVFLTPFC